MANAKDFTVLSVPLVIFDFKVPQAVIICNLNVDRTGVSANGESQFIGGLDIKYSTKFRSEDALKDLNLSQGKCEPIEVNRLTARHTGAANLVGSITVKSPFD